MPWLRANGQRGARSRPPRKLSATRRKDSRTRNELPYGSTSESKRRPGGATRARDEGMGKALRAGARIAKPAGPTFWGGYAGYFQDSDGHLWEVAWNPQLQVEDSA
jgi:catechol 2,3-dioxygenase-like lactoylglutathione lyase family enzyme